jgi:hypothetical protein
LEGHPNRVSITFDTKLGWAIRSYDNLPGDVPNPQQAIKYEVKYDPMAGGVPTPKLVKYTDPNSRTEVCEFEVVGFGPTPEREFSMEHYGLPDLSGRPTARTNGLLPVVVGLSVVGLLLGIILRWMAGRSRGRPKFGVST